MDKELKQKVMAYLMMGLTFFCMILYGIYTLKLALGR